MAFRPGHVLVVCGGQRTEPDYFKGMARARGVRLKIRTKADSPENLVRYAAAIFTACALLAKHVPGYAKRLDYVVFDAGVEAAVKRAEALGSGNPATDVRRLVKAVLKA